MIKRLRLQNCKTYEDSTIEFAPGVTVITGTSGHGKSNMLASLKWVNENRPLKNKCIRRGQPRGVAAVTIENNGQEVEIQRTKDIKSSGENNYMVTTNGVSTDPYESFGNDPPPEITQLFNLGELNRQKQIQPHFLVFDSPGKIARYIRSVTKLTEIDQVIQSITSKIRLAKDLLKSDTQALERKTVQLSILHEIPLKRMSELITEAEDLQTKNTGIKMDMAALSNILKNLRLLDKFSLTLPDNIDTMVLDVEQVVTNNVLAVKDRDALKGILSGITEIDNTTVHITDQADTLISDAEQATNDNHTLIMKRDTLRRVLDAITEIDATTVHVDDRVETLISEAEHCSEINNLTNKNIDTLLGIIDQVTSVDTDLNSLTTEIHKEQIEYQDLLEQLSECPECGSKLTVECKKHLLEFKG